eukprot:CCRYP_017757-RA/>CCRYP_017757-RA protein AED:0.25 eAED:1.00 QI:0/-1/0/1/-1/0/1/0/69
MLEEALHREGLKSLIIIVLALLHSAKSAATKKYRSSYPQGAILVPCKGRIQIGQVPIHISLRNVFRGHL